MTALSATHSTGSFEHKRTGMAAMVLAMALLPVGDAISKSLTSIIPPFEVTLLRTLAQAAFFLPTAWLMRRHLAGPILSWASVASACLIVTVLYSLITAFEVMPIATAISIFFVEPLLLTLLAGPFLGEVPGPRRFAAVGVGLLGALIVIRPNFAEFGPVVLLPLFAALGYALNMIVVRKARGRQSPLSFQFGASLCAAGLLLAAETARFALGFAPELPTVPGWTAYAVLAAGALSMVTFLMITFAFSRVEASLLAPFQYLEIVGATLVGFLIFGDIPDAVTFLGAGVILASGIYVFHRERKQADGHAVGGSEVSDAAPRSK